MRVRIGIVGLVLAAIAAAPAVASGAEPYWTSNGKILKEGVRETVTTSGALTIAFPNTNAKCKVTDTEEIENPVGGGAGVDTLTSFHLTNCKGTPKPCPAGVKLEVIALPGSWATELVGGTPIRDEIEGLELEERCSNNTVFGIWEGTLEPAVVNSTLEFGAGSGSLEEPIAKTTATVSGIDKLKGPPGDTKIGAEEVEHFPHWYSNGVRLAEGVVEIVSTKGTLTDHEGGSIIVCKTEDTEEIENPIGGGPGVDEVTAFTESGCKGKPGCPPPLKLVVKPIPPWESELLAGPPIRDELRGVEVEVRCVGTGGFTVLYTGNLTPEVGNSALVFGPGSGSLSPGGVTVTGSDAMKGPPGDTKITAEDP